MGFSCSFEHTRDTPGVDGTFHRRRRRRFRLPNGRRLWGASNRYDKIARPERALAPSLALSFLSSRAILSLLLIFCPYRFVERKNAEKKLHEGKVSRAR